MIQRWEALSPFVQGAIALPPLSVLLFVVNIGPFNQPVGRSIFYGVFEGAVVTALVLVATANEKSKRRSNRP
ncbi:MAG TPA: hypothetical protein VF160_02585 [Candidatus Dormibacteraeota bacterium]